MDISKRKLIGLRLRRKRKQFRLSQSDVMDALELQSTSRISQWENGEKLPGPQNMMKLAALYKTLEAELFYEMRMEVVEAIARYYKRVEAKRLKENKNRPP